MDLSQIMEAGQRRKAKHDERVRHHANRVYNARIREWKRKQATCDKAITLYGRPTNPVAQARYLDVIEQARQCAHAIASWQVWLTYYIWEQTAATQCDLFAARRGRDTIRRTYQRLADYYYDLLREQIDGGKN